MSRFNIRKFPIEILNLPPSALIQTFSSLNWKAHNTCWNAKTMHSTMWNTHNTCWIAKLMLKMIILCNLCMNFSLFLCRFQSIFVQISVYFCAISVYVCVIFSVFLCEFYLFNYITSPFNKFTQNDMYTIQYKNKNNTKTKRYNLTQDSTV
jgi:hypothetical protein